MFIMLSLWTFLMSSCFVLTTKQRNHLFNRKLRLPYKSTTVPGNKPGCSSKLNCVVCALKKTLPALISVELGYNKMKTTTHPRDPVLKTRKILNWWNTWSLKGKVRCTSRMEYTSKSMVRKIMKTWHFWTGLLPLPFFSLAVLYLEGCHANGIRD